MGTGKSIARAILGALGGGAEYYGDINKQRMMSSDDLYNALARLQMAEQLERSSPLYAQQLEEGKLKNRLTQAQLSEIDFVNNERAAIASKMAEATKAAATRQEIEKQAKAELDRLYPGQYPNGPVRSIPTTQEVQRPGFDFWGLKSAGENFERWTPFGVARKAISSVTGLDDFIARLKGKDTMTIPGVPMEVGYTAEPEALTPEQQRMADFAGTYEGTPEGASRAYIASREQRSKIQEVQDMAVAKVMGERMGRAATGGEVDEFNEFMRSIPKTDETKDMTVEDALDLFFETVKPRLAKGSLNASQAAGTGYVGQPVIKIR